MLTIDDYCDIAKKRNNFKSDRRLAYALDVSQAAVSDWRTKRKWPSDVLMVKLAMLAGLDPDIALLHLATWRADDSIKHIFVKMADDLEASRQEEKMQRWNEKKAPAPNHTIKELPDQPITAEFTNKVS